MEINAAARLRAGFSPTVIEDMRQALEEVLEHFHLKYTNLREATDFPHTRFKTWAALVHAPAVKVRTDLAGMARAEIKDFPLDGRTASRVMYYATEEHGLEGRISYYQAFLVLPHTDNETVVVSMDRQALKQWNSELY